MSFPRTVYLREGDQLVTRFVTEEEFEGLLDQGWGTNPAEVGLFTAPSQEDLHPTATVPVVVVEVAVPVDAESTEPRKDD